MVPTVKLERRRFLAASIGLFASLLPGEPELWATPPKDPVAPPLVPDPAKGPQALFDGKTLTGLKRTDFSGGGEVRVEGGLIVVDPGEELSGFSVTGEVPTNHYEIELEAERLSGLDFFCALTFPVGKQHLTFVVGGWGGSIVGISSINREDASMNETTSTRHFQDRTWYRIRLRVEPDKIQAWIGPDRVVNLLTADKDLDLRPGEIDLSLPLGVATFRTGAAFRNLQLRKLPAPAQ